MYYLKFHLDQLGYKGITLIASASLKEIDQFIINNFQNREDVINMYRSDIEEFCLDYRDDIREENNKHHNQRLGAITLFYDSKDISHKIGIIYGKDKKMLNDKDSFNNLKVALDNDDVLREILSKKKFLLTENEISLLKGYFNFDNFRYKNDALTFFLHRLKKMSKEERYYYYRVLMNICSLRDMVLPTKAGTIRINEIPTDNLKLTQKPESYSDDFYFNKVIEEENYDELFNLYGLEFISENSNVLDKDK